MPGLDQYFKSLLTDTKLTKVEERKLIIQAKNGDSKSYQRLMSCHLKFVISVARQYQNQGLPLDELIAEGNLGLVKAFNKFDTSRTNNFITYAVWWIRQSIMNSIHEHSKLIRLPVNKITNITRLHKLKMRFENRQGRQVSDQEFQTELEKLGEGKLIEDGKYSYSYVQLDTPRTENKKTLQDILPSPVDRTEIDLWITSIKEELDLILREFTEREKHIIYMYYGIDNVRTYTLEEIGVDLGLTRERIRQIKEKVLIRLRSRRLRKLLEPFLYDDLH
jgi:RNA polymerase primary sigma factor